MIGLSFRFSFRDSDKIWFSLDHKRNVSDGVVSGVGRNGNVLILLTLIPSCLWLRLQLRLLIFTMSQALLKKAIALYESLAIPSTLPQLNLRKITQSVLYQKIFVIFSETPEIVALGHSPLSRLSELFLIQISVPSKCHVAIE